MEEYIVKKILNNNVVVAENNRKEFVLVGKAIGFDFCKGSKLKQDRIENIFVKQTSSSNEKYDKILQSINSEIIGISEEIISFCEKDLGLKLSEAVHISLPDHINFAIRRIEEGIKIENPFLYELMALYPKEYKLAEKALNMINERFSARLPQDEIGFICLHIKAAITEENVGVTLAYTKKIGEIIALISKLLRKDFDKNSLEYVRTITHLNFMLERITNKKTIKNYVLDSIKKELYGEFDMAIKVAMKIESLFNVRVCEDEIGYIALHLKRLSQI